MTAPLHLPARSPGPLAPTRPRAVAATLGRLALAAAWTLRHPRERFAERPLGEGLERLYYRSLDGWEAPLWRLPPSVGASGEPVILAHTRGYGPQSLDWSAEGSLARLLHQAGFDVYLLEHRGDAHATCSQAPGPCDFDAIVAGDLPAALAQIREKSGLPRALWVGHGLGGQLLYGHLSRGGAEDLAAGITLAAAVRFQTPASRSRLVALATRLLPPSLRLPTRRLEQLRAPLQAAGSTDPGLLQDVEGDRARGLMVDGSADLPVGLLRQAARWVESGSLCDRDDRYDYLAGLRGLAFPLLAVASAGDRLCPPEAAWPAAEALAPGWSECLELDAGFGHLDPLVGRRAEDELHPPLLTFLQKHRGACHRAA